MVEDFETVRKNALEQRYQTLIEQYKVLNEKLNLALDASAEVKLKRQIDALEKEILSLERELRQLSTGVDSDGPVNRQEQVEDFKRLLRRIREQRTIVHTIIEYLGIPTIGKTALLDLLCQACTENDIPYARIDFDSQINVTRYNWSPDQIMSDIATQLDILPAPHNHDPHERRLPDPGRVMADIKQSPAVFFLDAIDMVHRSIWRLLERKVIGPLMTTGKHLFVLTGREGITWERLETRQRVRIEQLHSFDRQSVEDLLRSMNGKPDLAPLSSEVHRLTGGLPIGSYVIHEQIRKLQNRDNKSFDKATFREYEAELVKTLESVLRERIFQAYSSEIINTCYALALVRSFDQALFRLVLPRCLGVFRDEPENTYGSFWNKLNSTQLFVEDETCNRHHLEPALQSVIRRYMRMYQAEYYKTGHDSALASYQELIPKVADRRNHYILEALYHEACLLHVNSQAQSEVDFKPLLEHFTDYLTSYATGSNYSADLNTLATTLHHELDAHTDDSLGELLPHSTSEQLLSILNRQIGQWS